MISISSLLVAASLAPTALQQYDSLFAEALMIRHAEAPYSDGSGDTWTYHEIDNPKVLTGGGWLTWVGLARDPFSGSEVNALVGQRAGQFDGPVEVFDSWDRFPTDQNFGFPSSGSFVGSELLYLLRGKDLSTGLNTHDVIYAGNSLASLGDPVLGSNGWIWTGFESVTGTSDGSIFVVGQALEPTLGANHFMVAEVVSGTVLANGFDFVPGIPRRLIRADGFTVSADGSHWMFSSVMRQTLKTVLVVDGAGYEMEPGFPLVEDEPLPPGLVDDRGARWQSASPLHISSLGDITFIGRWASQQTAQTVDLFRNGRLVEGTNVFPFTDDRNAIVSTSGIGLQLRLNIEGQPTQPMTGMELDLDRDGSAEPGTTVVTANSETILAGDGALFIMSRFQDPSSSGLGDAFIRLRDYRIDEQICQGSPNSTGIDVRLSVSGRRSAQDNEFSVDVLELPVNSRGYLLFSTSMGAGVQPPGSQGELCLSGGIGRLQSSLFLAPGTGQARVQVDLTAIPQPSGSVPAMAGETWFTQAWYRDSIMGAATSNFSSAVSVTFL